MNTENSKATSGSKGSSNDNATALKSWYRDYYESAVVQRNFFILVAVAGVIATVLSILAIRHIKNTKSIEPFVIEIERKTGVPTIVDPLKIKEYAADEAVKRSLVVQYIRAREEYFYQTYFQNYNNIVRALSASSVYYGQYRSQHSKNNPTSNYNTMGKFGMVKVHFKSIIFTNSNTAQVRLSLEKGVGNTRIREDKIVLMSFDFRNGSLDEGDRMINPLGFMVNLYRIENENVVK